MERHRGCETAATVELQQLRGKPFTTRIKSRPVRTYFTICLPGSPKVNAGGACGAWLPGREPCGFPPRRAQRGYRSASFSEVETEPGITRTSIVPELASVCGHNFDELVQWMVQDAPLDRC